MANKPSCCIILGITLFDNSVFCGCFVLKLGNLIYHTPDYVAKLFPHYVFHGDRKKKHIFLTFDDGPIPDVTPWVLTVLASYGVKATFFCVGENLLRYPEIAESIINMGHDIGNHTFHHLNGWATNTKDYLENVRRFDEHLPSPLFRPPYGKLRSSQATQLKEDYRIVMWDILSGDYQARLSPKDCLRNSCGRLRNGSIIVFHDSLKAKKNLQRTLPAFIEFALKKDLIFSKL